MDLTVDIYGPSTSEVVMKGPEDVERIKQLDLNIHNGKVTLSVIEVAGLDTTKKYVKEKTRVFSRENRIKSGSCIKFN